MAEVMLVSKELEEALVKRVNLEHGWNLDEAMKNTVSRTYNLFFRSITDFMSKVKSVSGKVGFIAEDIMQNFMLGAVVECHKNEDENMPDNFSYSFTFDPKDLEGCEAVYKTSGNEYKEVAIDVAEHEYGYHFVSDDTGEEKLEKARTVVTKLMTSVAKCIRDWVEENSVDTEPRVTEIPNIAIIEAMIDETGTKVFAITPSGELKNIIKNDAALEQKKEAEDLVA